MVFTANPYDQTGTLDTTGMGGGENLEYQPPDVNGQTPDPIELGPDQSARSIMPAFTDTDLQAHSDARLQVGQIRPGSPY